MAGHLVEPDAVIASARHAPHRGKTEDRLRVAADLRIEERKRPREDVICKGIVEPMFNALSATSLRVPVRRLMPISVS